MKNWQRYTGKRNTVSSSNNQTTRLTIPSLTLRSEKKNNNGTERLRALKYFLDLLSSILVNPEQCLASFIPKKNKRYNSHDFPESNCTCCSPRVCCIRVNELLNLIQVSTVAWAHFRIFPFFLFGYFCQHYRTRSREQRSGINRIWIDCWVQNVSGMGVTWLSF